jgi:hypothetical protein
VPQNRLLASRIDVGASIEPDLTNAASFAKIIEALSSESIIMDLAFRSNEYVTLTIAKAPANTNGNVALSTVIRVNLDEIKYRDDNGQGIFFF